MLVYIVPDRGGFTAVGSDKQVPGAFISIDQVLR